MDPMRGYSTVHRAVGIASPRVRKNPLSTTITNCGSAEDSEWFIIPLDRRIEPFVEYLTECHPKHRISFRWRNGCIASTPEILR